MSIESLLRDIGYIGAFSGRVRPSAFGAVKKQI